MLNKTFIATIGTILLFSNCRTDNINPLTEFVNKKERQVSGENIKLVSDSILFKPFDFQIDDTLAILNDNTGEAGFTIVNLKTGDLIRKFAYSGSDSSEFDINALAMNSAVNNKSTFSITERNSPFKLFIYNWDSLLSRPVYKPNSVYYPEGFGFSDSFLLNDSMFLGKFSFSKFDGKVFGIVNLVSNKLMTGIDVPGINEDPSNLSDKDRAYFKWLNILLSDKVKHRPGSAYEFACFSTRGAVIHIFDIDKEYHFKEKYQKIYYLPTFNIIESPELSKLDPTPDCKNGFGSIAVTRERIYALFNGPELDNSYKNEWESDIVLVYDWDGKPLEKVRLDKKCGRIAIDENNPEMLYGLYGGMNAKIVRYKLPKN